MLPYLAFNELGGFLNNLKIVENYSPHYINIFYKIDPIMIISSLSWGLGYFGQPHILIRFMAIRDPKDIKLAKTIGILWMFFSLLGALCLGFVSISYFSKINIENPENVFIELTKRLYNDHILEGVMVGALLSAIISTISAQIIAATSALAEDIYHLYFRKNATNKELILFSRISIIILAFCSFIIALSPDTSILNKISYAWAGMGAAFGPLILISLFYSHVTITGAFLGIISGSFCVIYFPYLKYLGGWFTVYELFPSFIISSVFIIIVSKIEIYLRIKIYNRIFINNIHFIQMIKKVKRK